MIVGFLCSWGSERWVGRAIENVRLYTDKLFVNVGYHHPDLKEVEDGTATEVRRKTDKYDDVIWFDYPSNKDTSVSPDHWKCRILNSMMDKAKLSVGDVIAICDSDEFYTPDSVQEIGDFVVSSDFEMAFVQSYYFCVNFNWCFINPKMRRFFRYTTNDFRFVPTQKPSPKPKNTTVLDTPMYHYSMLLDPKMKYLYWNHSPRGDKKKQEMKKRWLSEVYYQWDVQNPEDGMKRNKEICGENSGIFWMTNDMEESGVGLFRYSDICDNLHPSEVRDLEDIDDFRERYNWTK